jgi:hypothetical protein
MLKLRQTIENKVLQFNEAIKTAKSENVALELLRDKRRFLAQNDLYWLCCFVGNAEIAKYPDYYKPFCDEVSLMNWKIVSLGMHKPNMYLLTVKDVTDKPEQDLNFMQRLYLCYRTFYKTTIITKLHSLQLLLNFPNIHIVLCHNKQENSSDNLVSIKNYFLTENLKVLYPKYIPNTKDWGNMSGFSVACRTDKGRSEENIEAVGVDTEITGRHYQVAKKNDLVTEKSVNTEEQIKKTLDWDERFNIGMFDDPQRKLQDYEGTRYHFSDLYSVKLNNPTIKLIDIPLLKDKNPDNVSIENISNPERFSIDGIQELKKNMWVFNCQLLLKPDDPARMQFKTEMIYYYTSIPQGCNFYLLVDPASRRKKRSDWTVMMIVGLGWLEGRIRKFIVDGVRDKLDPKQRVDMAIALAKKWEIKGCGWEAIGFQETDCFYLEEVRRKERMYFTIEEIDSHKVSKEDRIRSLIPDYAQHNWLWPQKGAIERMSFMDGRKFDLTTEMEYEFKQFPLCEHDDLLDTMTFLNRITTVNPEEIKTLPEREEMTFGEYAAIKDNRLSEFNRNPWNRLAIGGRV